MDWPPPPGRVQTIASDYRTDLLSAPDQNDWYELSVRSPCAPRRGLSLSPYSRSANPDTSLGRAGRMVGCPKGKG